MVEDILKKYIDEQASEWQQVQKAYIELRRQNKSLYVLREWHWDDLEKSYLFGLADPIRPERKCFSGSSNPIQLTVSDVEFLDANGVRTAGIGKFVYLFDKPLPQETFTGESLQQVLEGKCVVLHRGLCRFIGYY